MSNIELSETIALQAITYISGDERMLGGFLSQTGLSLEEIKGALTHPDFLGGILDFLLANETYLLDFCAAGNLDPNDIIRARQKLPGGDNLWDG